MRICCVEGCDAPAAALGACTTHLGLNGGPRVVPVPLEEKRKQRSRGLSRPEEVSRRSCGRCLGVCCRCRLV